jgi:hypothetical protein
MNKMQFWKKYRATLFFFFFFFWLVFLSYLPTTQFSQHPDTFIAVTQEQRIALDRVLPLVVKVEPHPHFLAGPIPVNEQSWAFGRHACDQPVEGLDLQRSAQDNQQVTLFKVHLGQLAKTDGEVLAKEGDLGLDQAATLAAVWDLVVHDVFYYVFQVVCKNNA